MIVTVTLNAALDRTVSVPNFQLQGRNRATESLALPGGKGVNVARALRLLGEPVIATGTAGGRAGTYIIEELTSEGILNDFVRIADESRTSTAVIDPTGEMQTEINEIGPSVSMGELATLREKIEYLSKSAELFVLAGSLPRDVPVDFYAELISDLRAKRMLTVVDVAGPPMRSALSSNPDLVSPNTREAEDVVGSEFGDADDVVAGARTLVEMGAANALIHGGDGCVACLKGEDGHHLYRAELPARSTASTIGSGDSFLAGYLAAWHRDASHEEALSRAVGAGAANTKLLGAGRLDVADLDAFSRMVRVERLD